MNFLILNAGSSSLKFSLYKMPEFNLLAKGICERIGLKGSFVDFYGKGDKKRKIIALPTHLEALNEVINSLTTSELKVIDSTKQIDLVGHMFVNGGEYFEPTIANASVIKKLKTFIDYAPVHMPNNIAVLEASMKIFDKSVPNMLYFDTTFHQTMPPKAYTYAINTKYTKKYNIRRYGFHGSSHEYMAQKVLEYNPKAKKIITCHLGNGCSISAILNGKCMDTTMGFTPLEGIVMGTRCGNIDASIVAFMCKKFNLTPDEVINILNFESGLKGLCGYSDLRDIEERANQGDKNCIIALDTYCYSIAKHIGAYLVTLHGIDALTFGGGVGENSSFVREKILDYLDFLGIIYDKALNNKINRMPDKKISKAGSDVDIYVISTNEEYIVAKNLYKCFVKKV